MQFLITVSQTDICFFIIRCLTVALIRRYYLDVGAKFNCINNIDAPKYRQSSNPLPFPHQHLIVILAFCITTIECISAAINR